MLVESGVILSDCHESSDLDYFSDSVNRSTLLGFHHNPHGDVGFAKVRHLEYVHNVASVDDNIVVLVWHKMKNDVSIFVYTKSSFKCSLKRCLLNAVVDILYCFPIHLVEYVSCL